MGQTPDFVKLAEAYGAVGLNAKKPSEVEGVLLEAFRVKKPVVMNFEVDPMENVYPMVPAGGANHQMVFRDPDDGVPDSKATKDVGQAAGTS